MKIFNQKLLRKNRDRVSGVIKNADFLIKEFEEIITEKITDCKRNFDNILEIGARDGNLGKQIFYLKNSNNLVQVDCSRDMLKKINGDLKLVADDEFLCFKEDSFDLIISNLNFHFINDVSATLGRIKKILKPGGLFIASFFGENNLTELRTITHEVELKNLGGISPRVAPMMDVKTAGMLLQEANFFNPVSEKYCYNIQYSKPIKLLTDLKQMGQGNIMNNKSKRFITRKFLFDLLESYSKKYSSSQGQINATFEIIIITGWRKN